MALASNKRFQLTDEINLARSNEEGVSIHLPEGRLVPNNERLRAEQLMSLVQAKEEIKKESMQYCCVYPQTSSLPLFLSAQFEGISQKSIEIPTASSDILSVINTCAQNHSQGRAEIQVQLAG